MISLGLKNRLLTSIILIFLTIIIIKFDFILLYILLVFGVFSIIEFIEIIKKISSNRFSQLFQNFVFIIFIFFFSYLFFLFSNIQQLKIILFILLSGCIASDIGGFIFGKIFKGPKLTSISPKKTISGAIGSLFFSMIIINFLFFFYTKNFNIQILLVSIFTSIGCQFGDLFFSYLKRKAKIKDTGNILPGHGGILDRLDGIYLGIPVGFASLIILY
tara:strand:+ start:3303 stop:3953 length:651 start_codon:yes stop_codon:yes gene_type:complete